MANMLRLRGEWVAQGYTNESFAKKIGINKATMSRWINGDSDKVTIGAAKTIVRTLDLSEKLAYEIFFT